MRNVTFFLVFSVWKNTFFWDMVFKMDFPFYFVNAWCIRGKKCKHYFIFLTINLLFYFCEYSPLFYHFLFLACVAQWTNKYFYLPFYCYSLFLLFNYVLLVFEMINDYSFSLFPLWQLKSELHLSVCLCARHIFV